MLSSKEFLGLSYQFHADRIVISSENNRQHAHPMLHACIHPSFKTNKQTEKQKNTRMQSQHAFHHAMTTGIYIPSNLQK